LAQKKKKKTRINGPDIPVISQAHKIVRFHERTLGFLDSYFCIFETKHKMLPMHSNESYLVKVASIQRNYFTHLLA